MHHMTAKEASDYLTAIGNRIQAARDAAKRKRPSERSGFTMAAKAFTLANYERELDAIVTAQIALRHMGEAEANR